MKSTTLLPFLALATVALGASIRQEVISKHTTEVKKDDEALGRAGRALEVLGQLLQGKETLEATNDKVGDVLSALQLFSASTDGLDGATSEYFWKKIRRAVENVAKVVAINKAVGVVAGALG